MAALKKLALCGVMLVVSACSMQPLIDLSVPRDERDASKTETPQPQGDNKSERESGSTAAAQRQPPLPRAALALVAKADQQLTEGDSPAAIASLERALAMAPRSPQLYYELAKAYAASNNTDSARSFANKALSLSPDAELEHDINLLLTTLSRVSLF